MIQTTKLNFKVKLFILLTVTWSHVRAGDLPFGEYVKCSVMAKFSKKRKSEIYETYAKKTEIPYEESLGILCSLELKVKNNCSGLEDFFDKSNFKIVKQNVPFEDSSIDICRITVLSDEVVESDSSTRQGGVFLFDEPPTFLTKLGFQKNDLVLKINDKRINVDKAIPLYELNRYKGKHKIELERNGELIKFEVLIK